MSTLKEEIEEAQRVVASWPKWMRDLMEQDMAAYDAEMRERVKRPKGFRDPNGYCDNPARGY